MPMFLDTSSQCRCRLITVMYGCNASTFGRSMQLYFLSHRRVQTLGRVNTIINLKLSSLFVNLSSVPTASSWVDSPFWSSLLTQIQTMHLTRSLTAIPRGKGRRNTMQYMTPNIKHRYAMTQIDDWFSVIWTFRHTSPHWRWNELSLFICPLGVGVTSVKPWTFHCRNVLMALFFRRVNITLLTAVSLLSCFQ